MDDLTLKLIQLDHCRGAGRRTVQAFLRTDPELKFLDCCTPEDLMERFRLTRRRAFSLLTDFRAFNPRKAVNDYRQRSIIPIPIHSRDYPPLLREIYDPPYILYARGKTELLKNIRMLSVVGTRRPSVEAAKVMKRLLLPLIDSGWTIVSGLALGVDGMAHRLALRSNTIAVLGSGLLFPYPARHIALYEELCASQLVISEYAPDRRPERWMFPERNRIISGLSAGTLVIEAGQRSGSLITADQALEQGREVFAVPGSILNENSAGTNRLIQQGAKLVAEPDDIIEELKICEI